MHTDRGVAWGIRQAAGSGPTLLLLTLAALTLVSTVPGISAAHSTVANATATVGGENISITATTSLSFVPNQFSVAPGASVHLVVTQDADFEHTFTLSSVANITNLADDSSAQLAAFFNSHPPIVNLSLGSTIGARFFANFTAPAAGTYEFVCLIHYAEGMTGEMVSSAGASSSSPSAFPLTTVVIGVLVVAVVVVAATVVLVTRRRKKGPAVEPPTVTNPPK